MSQLREPLVVVLAAGHNKADAMIVDQALIPDQSLTVVDFIAPPVQRNRGSNVASARHCRPFQIKAMRSTTIRSAPIAKPVIEAALSFLAVDDVVETGQPATALPRRQSGVAGGQASAAM